MSNPNTSAPNTNSNEFEPAPPRMILISDIITSRANPAENEPLEETQPIKLESEPSEEESDSSDVNYEPSQDESEETIRVSTIPPRPSSNTQRGRRTINYTARISIRPPQIETFVIPATQPRNPNIRRVRSRTTEIGESSNSRPMFSPISHSPVTQYLESYELRIVQLEKNNEVLAKEVANLERHLTEACKRIMELEQQAREAKQRASETTQQATTSGQQLMDMAQRMERMEDNMDRLQTVNDDLRRNTHYPLRKDHLP